MSKYSKRILKDIKDIFNLATSSYQLVERTIELYRNSLIDERKMLYTKFELELDFLLEKIERLDDKEFKLIKKEHLPDFNRMIVEEILMLKSKVKIIDQYMAEIRENLYDVPHVCRKYQAIKEELGKIINIERAEFKEETEKEKWFERISKAPLYNGTCLAIIYAVLNWGNGIFGWDKPHLYLTPKEAQYYSESKQNLNYVRKIYKAYGKDFDRFNKKTKALLLKGFIMEFDHTKMEDAKFNGIEEGRVEFVVKRPVTLKNLTERCKLEIIKSLGINKKSQALRILF